MREDRYERLCVTLALLIIVYYITVDLIENIRVIIDLWEFYRDDILSLFDSFRYQIIELIVMTLGFVGILMLRKKGLPYLLGICAMIIAFDCSMEAYLMLIDVKEYATGIELFLDGAFSLIIAVMLFFNTIMFLRGLSKSVNLIKYGVLALIVIQLLSAIMSLRSGADLSYVFSLTDTSVPQLLMLFLVLFMTSAKTIRQTSIMGNIGLSIKDMRNSLMEEGIGIGRPTADRFADFNEKGLWCEQFSFLMASYSRGRYTVTLRRIGERTVANISSVDNHSGMNNFRFSVAGVWFDTGDVSTCDVMRFYSDDGIFIQLIVRDIPVPKPIKIPKIGAIVLLSKEVGTTTNRIRIKLTEFGYKVLDVLRAIGSKIKRK